MKILIIFRGENVRINHPHGNRKYIDALLCWNNWKETLINDIKNNGDECDIAFITYDSPIIEKIKEIIQPKYMQINERINQINNFRNVISFTYTKTEEYDRFVILRCDIKYRIPITKWPKWNETGIFIVNKDAHWPTKKIYADIIFLLDKTHLNTFVDAFNNDILGDSIHALGRSLYNSNIHFHLLYEDYYHMCDHPLHLLASIEDDPDLNNPISGNKIIDVSEFN